MISIQYIILFWIIFLILFIFYCIFRLNYVLIPATTNANIIKNNINKSQNNFKDIIQYLDEEKEKNTITKLPGCENVYNDNIAVRSLGYRNCDDAYTDYFNNNLDINKKYGNNKTLAEICPVSTKSDSYMKCMKQLLNKFNTNADIVDGINTDMSNIINNRIQNRNNIIAGIETDLSPFLNSQKQTDFYNANLLGQKIYPSPDNSLRYIDNYYMDKYGISKSIFDNITTEHFTNTTTTNSQITNSQIDFKNTLDSYIENNFLGVYKPVKGQYLTFDNLTLILNYKLKSNSNSTNSTNSTDSTNELNNPSNNASNKTIMLSIVDNNSDTQTQLNYNILDVDYYKAYKNIIKLEIDEVKIDELTNTDSQRLKQLLIILGIELPTRLFITLDKFTSDAGKIRYTYKLLNINMDTIMIMDKISI